MTPLDKHIALIHEENHNDPLGAINNLLSAMKSLYWEVKEVAQKGLPMTSYSNARIVTDTLLLHYIQDWEKTVNEERGT